MGRQERTCIRIIVTTVRTHVLSDRVEVFGAVGFAVIAVTLGPPFGLDNHREGCPATRISTVREARREDLTLQPQ
jgi:hypothetical protein